MRWLWIVLALAACGNASEIEVITEEPESGQLLEFFVGSYVEGDARASGALRSSKDRHWINLEALPLPVADRLRSYVAGSKLPWDSLSAFVQATYYDARELPESIRALTAASPPDQAQVFEVHGPVTRYLRRIFVPEEALRAAISHGGKNRRQIRYPSGTVIRAEHIDSGRVMETTAMIRRSDGYWDFATYDSTGRLTPTTQANPRALNTPTECVGCHFGTKPFEPEASWPLSAPAGPDGTRQWYTGKKDLDVSETLNEHMRRSDGVLGIYATAYMSNIRMGRLTGVLSEQDDAMLAEYGL